MSSRVEEYQQRGLRLREKVLKDDEIRRRIFRACKHFLENRFSEDPSRLKRPPEPLSFLGMGASHAIIGLNTELEDLNHSISLALRFDHQQEAFDEFANIDFLLQDLAAYMKAFDDYGEYDPPYFAMLVIAEVEMEGVRRKVFALLTEDITEQGKFTLLEEGLTCVRRIEKDNSKNHQCIFLDPLGAYDNSGLYDDDFEPLPEITIDLSK